MPLGTEVGLGPGDIVLDGDPARPQKGHSSPSQFSAHVYCGQTVAPISATDELLLTWLNWTSCDCARNPNPMDLKYKSKANILGF